MLNNTLQPTGNWSVALSKLAHYKHDKCSVCGLKMSANEPAFAGYDSEGNPTYVGHCHFPLLKELVSYVSWWFTDYVRPEPYTRVWRYLDISKFLALLQRSALHLSRLDSLHDPFEGARGLASREQEWREYCLNYFRNVVSSTPTNSALTPDYIEQQALRMYWESVASGRRERECTYVSCWHANEGESEALWRLYVPEGSTGVAIRTTCGRLDSSLDPNWIIRMGMVKYVDFSNVFSGTYDRAFYKRISLSHESEMRAVFQMQDGGTPTPPYLEVPINLSTAIETVVVSPFSPDWVYNTLLATVQKLGFNIPVQRSHLAELPFY